MATFSTIMVPVDLQHVEKMEKAVSVATDMARQYGASICLVGVTTAQPNEVARTLDQYREKLAQFAEEKSTNSGIEMTSQAIDTADPLRDLDAVLDKAIKDMDADLVVMASHVPSFADYLLASNSGRLASHSSASVFVVR